MNQKTLEIEIGTTLCYPEPIKPVKPKKIIPKNFFHHCIIKSKKKPSKIYAKLGWSRQLYRSYMRKGRHSSPKLYRTFRQALGWSKDRFYNELIDYYDRPPDDNKRSV